MNNTEVLVKFKGDTQDLDKKTSTAKKTLKGLATGVGTAFGIAATAVGVASTAVANLVKQSVDAYAEFEQLEGGLISLFGEGSKEMQNILEKSENAYKTLTLSQNQYLNAFQTSYPLVNAGLSENADAIEYTNTMLQISSDLFNTYGGSIEQYQSAINWALKGSFVYLDNLNLGIKGTQEGFIEAANKSGVLARNIESVKELTNDEIIDVIKHYAQEYGVWEKTSNEATETILGSLNMVKATWSNFISGLSQKGKDVNTLIDQLTNAITTFVDNIIPVIVRAIGGIAKALPKLVKSIIKELPGLIEEILPPLIEAVNTLIVSVAEILPELLPTLMEGVVNAITSLAELLPTILDLIIKATIYITEALAKSLPDLFPTLIKAILELIPVIIENLPMFIWCGIELAIGLLKGIVMSIPEIIKGIVGIGESIGETFQEYFPKARDIGTELLRKFGEGILKIWDWLKNQVANIRQKLYNIFIEMPSRLLSIGINMIMGLWNGINSKVQWIINKIKGFGSSVIKAIKGIFGVHSPSTEFEWIGKMNMIGLENGMENMKSQVQDTINGLFNLQPNISGNMSSTYSPETNVIVNNNMEIDPLGQVVNQIKTFSGGAKNDYNWGAGQ